MTESQSLDPPFLAAYRGSFRSALSWADLDALWDRLREHASEGWYVYAVGEPPPTQCADPDRLLRFIEEIDKLLHRDHQESYCGIVYADDPEVPAFVKIYDPHNLGVTCGYSDHPPLPGWILSRLPPCDLPAALPPPRGRRHWWQRLLS